MSRCVVKRWPDGQFLAWYDPDWQPNPLPAGEEEWRCGLSEWTDNVYEALVFDSFTAAMDCWNQTSSTHPVRGDGRPNKPLTAYSIEVIPAPPIKGESHDAPPQPA